MVYYSHLSVDEQTVTLIGTVGNFEIGHPFHTQHQVCDFLCLGPAFKC